VVSSEAAIFDETSYRLSNPQISGSRTFSQSGNPGIESLPITGFQGINNVQSSVTTGRRLQTKIRDEHEKAATIFMVEAFTRLAPVLRQVLDSASKVIERPG